jgi:hypothetical protein
MGVEVENLKMKMKLIGRRAESSFSSICYSNSHVFICVASLFES